MKMTMDVSELGHFLSLAKETVVYRLDLGMASRCYERDRKKIKKSVLPLLMTVHAIQAFHRKHFPHVSLEISQLQNDKKTCLETLDSAMLHCTFYPQSEKLWGFQSSIVHDDEIHPIATAVVSLSAESTSNKFSPTVQCVQDGWQEVGRNSLLFTKLESCGLGPAGIFFDDQLIEGDDPKKARQNVDFCSLQIDLMAALIQCCCDSEENGAEKSSDDGVLMPFYVDKAFFCPQSDVAGKAKLYMSSQQEYHKNLAEELALVQNGKMNFYLSGIECRTRMFDMIEKSRPVYHMTWTQVSPGVERVEKRGHAIGLQFCGQKEDFADYFFSEEVCGTDLSLKLSLFDHLGETLSGEMQSIKLLVYFATVDKADTCVQAFRIFFQWLIEVVPLEKLAIQIITLHGQSVTQNEWVDPVQMQLWAIARVVRHEKPKITLTMVDVETAHDIDKKLDKIDMGCEWQFVKRNQSFFVPRLRQVLEPAQMRLSCSKEKMYLIVGGTGGLGLSISKLLARCGATKLGLVSRTGLPSSPDVIKELQAMGVEVNLYHCDITCDNQIHSVLSPLLQKVAIAGIVFSVGSVEDRLIERQNRQTFAEVLKPKMYGIDKIRKLVNGIDLEFFVVFSSISATFGMPGQTNYAAANAYLDAYCHNISEGYPCVSIAWGPWDKVGLAAQSKETISSVLARYGIEWISEEEAAYFFKFAIFSGVKNCVAGIFNWPNMSAAADVADKLTWLSSVLPTQEQPVQMS